MKGLIVLRHLKVENANAIAGMTWGFPAVAAFLGFTHALQRRYNEKAEKPLTMLGCGIVCHQHQTHAYQTHEFGDYLFALTRNPLDKTGSSPSFVEEGRMHLDVSLLLPVDIKIKEEGAMDLLSRLIQSMRLAGGTIVSFGHIGIEALTGGEEANNKILRRTMCSLLPGFALVGRHDILARHQLHRKQTPGPLASYSNSDADLQAWLEFSCLSYSAKAAEKAEGDDDENRRASWPVDERPYKGWLRPIAVGYKALTPLFEPGEVGGSRDGDTPVRFVEPLYSLGQWLGPHRIKDFAQLWWHYSVDEQTGSYRCINRYPETETSADLASAQSE